MWETEAAARKDAARARVSSLEASLSIADDARRTRVSMQVADAVKTLFAHLLHLLPAQIQSLPETVAVAVAAGAAVEA